MTTDQHMTQITPVGDRAIRIRRMFDAPRAQVWRALTDPGSGCAVVGSGWRHHDSRSVGGGRRRRLADGCHLARGRSGFRGTFREVSAPERISRSFEWEGMPGHVAIKTMTLEDLGERTRLVVDSTFHFGEERDGMLASGMERGTKDIYIRLDAVLAELDGSA